MTILTYRCGQCEGNPVFESENGFCEVCGTHGIQQSANCANDDRSPNFVDAKPPIASITPELSGELDGADSRPTPIVTPTVPDFGTKPEDRRNY